MLKKEILGTLKTKRVLLFIVIMLIIPLIDLYQVGEKERVWDKIENREEILQIDKQMKELCEEKGFNFTSNWIIHPAKASYLSGSSEGHLTQIILLWLLPLYALNLFSDRYISEYSRGYVNVVLARTSRKKYYFAKIMASFIIPFGVYLISLLVNFGLAQIIFYEGYNFNGMELFAEYGGWFAFMYDSPNLAYMIYALATAVAAGLCGVICQCVAFLTKKYVITYLITFFIWMAMVMMDDSITYLMQPFTEYGLDYMIRSGAILLGVTLICIVIVAAAKVKKDELQ
ncbi:MAG: hypothetical protein IJ272_03550 [Clostridia bacterium]|nr:hypothetical protein [Clostridia bacterium]